MPVLPPFAAQLSDTVTSVLNAARVRLNDELKTLYPVGAHLLENNAVFTQQVSNNAWRRMQEHLANIGYTALKQEAVISALPVVASLDPATQVRIDWFNYFDGANLFDAPVLPADMIIPLKLWERPNGQSAVFPVNPMELCFDGLPSRNKQAWSGCWEWRAGAIYMPGALQVMDLRLLYSRYLGDFVDAGSTQWFQQPVPLVRSQDAFSLFICAEIAETREDLDGAVWTAKAEASAGLMANRDVAMKQRGNVRRQSRSGRLESGGGYAW